MRLPKRFLISLFPMAFTGFLIWKPEHGMATNKLKSIYLKMRFILERIFFDSYQLYLLA